MAYNIIYACRKKQQTETPPKEPGYWAAGERCNSPSPDVYNVIRRQHESDLAGTRPDIKNTSFLGSSPDTPPGDYDNLAGRDTESGFVTLASTESGFVTNDLYDTLQGRGSGRYYRDQGWMDELYGYWYDRRTLAFNCIFSCKNDNSCWCLTWVFPWCQISNIIYCSIGSQIRRMLELKTGLDVCTLYCTEWMRECVILVSFINH